MVCTGLIKFNLVERNYEDLMQNNSLNRFNIDEYNYCFIDIKILRIGAGIAAPTASTMLIQI